MKCKQIHSRPVNSEHSTVHLTQRSRCIIEGPIVVQVLVVACLIFVSVPVFCDCPPFQGSLLQQAGDLTGGVVFWSHEAYVFVSMADRRRLLLIATYTSPLELHSCG